MRVGQLLRFRSTSLRSSTARQEYVPHHKPVVEDDIKRLEDFLLSKPNVLVLTGAGISTESGEFHDFPTFLCSEAINTNISD